jgi:hypothetical protein
MVTAKDQQGYEAKIKGQRHGSQPEGGIADAHAPRISGCGHLTSGAVVKL